MDTPHDRPESNPAPQRRSGSEGSFFKPLLPGQGLYVRWGTVIGAFGVSAAGAWRLNGELAAITGPGSVATILIPVVLLAALSYLIYWLVGRYRPAVDFMVATEGEMKKVSWTTRQELYGATRVVIFTVLALGLILFLVDVLFMVIFSSIGVLQVNVLEQLFGSSGVSS